MQSKHNKFGSVLGTAQMQSESFVPIYYYYLFAGIMLLVAVFLFLPRVPQ